MRLSRNKPDLIFAAGIQIVFLWNYAVSSTAATCNDEQGYSCRKAAAAGHLSLLPAGGHCMAKQYVQFTHLCQVTWYRPSVSYCCCEFEQRVLCCRYHQDWDTFRCTQGEDTVHTETKTGLPLEILLPSILGPAAILLCCVFCCIKCCCYRYEDEPEFFCCSSCSKCCTEDHKTKKIREKPPVKSSNTTPDDASMPLTGTHPQSSSQNQYSYRDQHKQTTDINDYHPSLGRTFTAPSAPPLYEDDMYSAVRTSESSRDVGFASTFSPGMYTASGVHVISGEKNDAYSQSRSSDTSSSGSHYSALSNRPLSSGATTSNMAAVVPANDNAAAMATVCHRCHCNVGEVSAPPTYDESQETYATAPTTQVPDQNNSTDCDHVSHEKC